MTKKEMREQTVVEDERNSFGDWVLFLCITALTLLGVMFIVFHAGDVIDVVFSSDKATESVKIEYVKIDGDPLEDMLNWKDLYFTGLENEQILEPLNKMADLGFTGTPAVRKSEAYQRAKRNAATILENIETYAEKYPNNPFITEDEVGRIAKRYGMIVADVSRLTVDIPQDNMDAIIEFSDNYIRPEFKVMAYADQLELDGLRLRDGVFAELPPDPDPIVFCQVSGGYLFVTAWGEDAKLPMQDIEKWLDDKPDWYTDRTSILGDLSFGGGAVIYYSNSTGEWTATADTVWMTIGQ